MRYLDEPFTGERLPALIDLGERMAWTHTEALVRLVPGRGGFGSLACASTPPRGCSRP